MAIVGLIPFVYAAIKKKRRSTARAADHYYAGPPAGGAAWGHEHARGASYQYSQSCHFAVCPSPDDEVVGFSSGDYGSARHHPPRKDKDLSRSRELIQADRHKRATSVAPASGWEKENARLDCGHQSQSCRFAVLRPFLPVHEPVVSRDEGASGGSPAQPDDLSRQLLLPAPSRRDGLAPGAAQGREHARSDGSAYGQSQSCRFAVRRSAAYELGLSRDEEYSAASTSPEDLSGRQLVPAGRRENGLSRSLRFSSMRVLAWVSPSVASNNTVLRSVEQLMSSDRSLKTGAW